MRPEFNEAQLYIPFIANSNDQTPNFYENRELSIPTSEKTEQSVPSS